ncbi:hypothetical protein LSH36_635g00051 [Paralvinella palmiformis]|uniref:GDP-D-glucose phosphorylase 1 n=1 Tax=Paralvinella palmiformis TaxID=53620 RepID=A0AAD9J462_9ANNE|nr:hypothetical protein LSH36_635g00051 [Paralvinella palmiformis]
MDRVSQHISNVCTNGDNMLESEIPDFGYSEEDFVLSVQTWHEFSKSPKQSELNIERVMKRRAPEVIESINQPFSSEKFNFTKIKPEEILMNFCPLDNSIKNCTQSDDVKQTMRGRHQIVINNSPFTFGHCLLLPDVAQCIPQPVDQLVGECYQLIDMPSKGFVFQLFGNTVDNLARAVFSVADYFQLNDIAHNVFITRGTLFGEDKDSANTTVRVYLWPRKHYIVPERFSDLTEAEIVSEVKQAMLPEDKYKQICDDIKLIIQSQQHVNC